MSVPSFDELWQKLCSADESVEIEAKRARAVGKDIWETVAAFSNEPDRGGGFLLLGVARKEDALFPDYEVVGVRDVGLIVFGKTMSIRRHLPMTRVDYIRVEGREWVPDPDRRYQSVEKLGPLLLTVPALVGQILEDIPKAFSLAEDGIQRRDVPLVPRKVIREAMVNAVMHRSYQRHQPVQIIRYANRIEIKNPGYSLVPDERLGEPGSKTRNPKIAAILHDVGYAETKGTGIRAMRDVMDQANLSQPLFESDRAKDEFTVRLLVVHLLSPEDWQWLSQFRDCGLDDDDARALIVLRELGAIDNAVYRSINHIDTLTASGCLRRLRDAGLLEQHGKGAGTYYRPGSRLRIALGSQTKPELLRPEPPALRPESPALRPEFPALRPDFEALRAELPAELQAELEQLGERAAPAKLDAVLIGLTQWRPLGLDVLAGLTGRAGGHLRKRNIKRLLADGQLAYLYPDEPNHPDQKYVAQPEAQS